MDWLETLDPEVIGSCPDLQQRLLFSRSKVGCAARTGTGALASGHCLLGYFGALLPAESGAQFSSTFPPHITPAGQIWLLGTQLGGVGACGPRCSQRGLGGAMADRQERSGLCWGDGSSE